MSKGSNFQEDLLERLKDPEYAAGYIAAAMEENDPSFLQVVLGDVIRAHGVSKISEITGIARQALYKMISEDGNPTMKNVNKLLDAVGLEIDVKAKIA
jgi:probable addiction module antidote protein